MSALSPGPAPGLVNEWISAPVFWAILASLVVVALIVFTAEMFRDRDEPAPDLEPARDVCDLESCDQPARIVFNAGIGFLYICEGHAAKVSEWAPVIGILAPFDQEAS
jgi:hypothetical protein